MFRIAIKEIIFQIFDEVGYTIQASWCNMKKKVLNFYVRRLYLYKCILRKYDVYVYSQQCYEQKSIVPPWMAWRKTIIFQELRYAWYVEQALITQLTFTFLRNMRSHLYLDQLLRNRTIQYSMRVYLQIYRVSLKHLQGQILSASSCSNFTLRSINSFFFNLRTPCIRCIYIAYINTLKVQDTK